MFFKFQVGVFEIHVVEQQQKVEAAHVEQQQKVAGPGEPGFEKNPTWIKKKKRPGFWKTPTWILKNPDLDFENLHPYYRYLCVYIVLSIVIFGMDLGGLSACSDGTGGF